MKKSFAASIEKNNAIVYDIRFTQDGEKAFAIIKVNKAKHAIFKVKLGKDNFDLADYGDILHKGWGEPTEDIKVEMHEKYGMYEEPSTN